MVSIFCECSPISFKTHGLFFWCLFSDPYLNTYHSNIGVWIIGGLELGTSTLARKSFVEIKWGLNAGLVLKHMLLNYQ